MTDDSDEQHTGVAEAGDVEYHYEHVETVPEPDSEMYRVEAYVQYTDRPIHRNVYFVPADRLSRFLTEMPENIVDVRPVTRAQAEAELAGYRVGDCDD